MAPSKVLFKYSIDELNIPYFVGNVKRFLSDGSQKQIFSGLRLISVCFGIGCDGAHQENDHGGTRVLCRANFGSQWLSLGSHLILVLCFSEGAVRRRVELRGL